MLSYHNDPAVKAKYIARFEAHRAADEVIQGTGFHNGRGCFVGCTLDNYDHSRFPIELGWPEWLAHLADSIFEGLPKKEAPQFGSDLLAAVPVGVDLEPVRHHIGIKRMDRLIALQTKALGKHGVDGILQEVIAALELVRRCHDAEINAFSCDWSAARSAARAAAESAAFAAWSAARSAARSAEESAWSDAESVAKSAARAAESAAKSAVESAAKSAVEAEAESWQRERDTLLDVLRGMAAQAAGGE